MADEYIRLDITIMGIDGLINEAPTGSQARALFRAKDMIYGQQRYVSEMKPVKHGRWIDHEKFERKNCNVCIECSVCNTWFGHDCIPKTKFCPNCGARMDGDTNG